MDTLHETSLRPLDRTTLNGSLTPQRNATNLALIGAPRASYNDHCQPVTNPAIRALILTTDVGPFRITGLKPAVEALRQIFAEIRAELPAIYPTIGTAGMLCCRLVRGSATSISNHAWGTAIDLTINGHLEPLGDMVVNDALLAIHPIFNRHKFFWGAAFTRPDAMHFEASDQLIRDWARAGLFDNPAAVAPPHALTFGDRGPAVEALQTALNAALGLVEAEADRLAVDGIFGKDTRAQVVEFQRRKGMTPTGTANEAVLNALGLDG